MVEPTFQEGVDFYNWSKTVKIDDDAGYKPFPKEFTLNLRLQPRRFRKKPVEIQAIQWFPDPKFSEFVNGKYINHRIGYDVFNIEYTVCDVGLQTLEGFMHIKPGDWIITGIKGERYPCKPDIFEATYEAI